MTAFSEDDRMTPDPQHSVIEDAVSDAILAYFDEALDAQELPAPRPTLWASINERLIPRNVIPLSQRRRPATARRLSMHWLVAASLVMMSITGIAYVLTAHTIKSRRQQVQQQASTVAPLRRGSQTPSTALPTTTSVTDASVRTSSLSNTRQSYDQAIAQLQATLQEKQNQLDPETVRTVEKNLRIIDDAIRQSRAALARDPMNGFLNRQLNSAQAMKITLLRNVVLLSLATSVEMRS